MLLLVGCDGQVAPSSAPHGTNAGAGRRPRRYRAVVTRVLRLVAVAALLLGVGVLAGFVAALLWPRREVPGR